MLRVRWAMIDPIRDAVIAAGRELSDDHDWGIDDGDGRIEESIFFTVVHKHVMFAVSDDWKTARIDALRAEIAELEGD